MRCIFSDAFFLIQSSATHRATSNYLPFIGFPFLMKTRSPTLFSLWYALAAVLFFTALGAVWMGIRLTQSPRRVVERHITPETALVRYVAPPVGDTGNPESILRALDHSLAYFRQLPPDTERRFGNELVPVVAIIETLEDLKTHISQEGLSPEFFRYLTENYLFYKASTERGLVTGYFESEVEGSMTPDQEYRYPLYAPPLDLVQLREPSVSLRVGDPAPERVGRLTPEGAIVPFYTRREIDGEEVLKGRGLEIVYLKDPIARFFLHIQGSGTVLLREGGHLRVGFAARNGLPYRPIGRLLVERGILPLEQVSMQSISDYLRAHPEQIQEIFNYNESYVFFRPLNEGPIGSIGVPVTPYRTVATDARLFPQGAVGFLITDIPVATAEEVGVKTRTFNGLVLNQDAGDAIKGSGRVDLFTGRGPDSEAVAGMMKQSGMLYFLLKKRS